MEVKYNNKWHDVLDTREFFGSTFYAIEDECRVKWLKDTDVEKNKNKVMAADKMEEILKHFPDLEEGWKEMKEKLKTEPAEREMLSLKYRERLEMEMLKENLPEPEFTKTKRAESDLKVMKAPDKIYMPNELLSEEWQRHIEGEDVEYVRADILIKKACEYLQEHLIDYWSQGVTDESKFIDEFIEYIKGEEV